MINNQSYVRAQRQYDAQLPYTRNVREIQCPECDGQGCKECDFNGFRDSTREEDKEYHDEIADSKADRQRDNELFRD